jgi:hypothetical protein
MWQWSYHAGLGSSAELCSSGAEHGRGGAERERGRGRDREREGQPDSASNGAVDENDAELNSCISREEQLSVLRPAVGRTRFPLWPAYSAARPIHHCDPSIHPSINTAPTWGWKRNSFHLVLHPSALMSTGGPSPLSASFPLVCSCLSLLVSSLSCLTFRLHATPV